ncbi:MAG TPA: IMP cyclohydrolase, partial [Caproiciproducens sp.]|nr:IMP cyclohydrolase [Caproiciproducens sp.]
SVHRYFYEYDSPVGGEGHFVHTYEGDGNPLPSFAGEPTLVHITGDIDRFTETVWNSLNEENKVSLFTRFINIKTGIADTRIVNKNR